MACIYGFPVAAAPHRLERLAHEASILRCVHTKSLDCYDEEMRLVMLGVPRKPEALVATRSRFHGCARVAILVAPALLAASNVQKRRRFRHIRCATSGTYTGPLGGSVGPQALANIFNAAGAGVAGGGGAERRSPEQQEARQRVLQSIREFKMLPKDVKRYLDRFVVEQDAAKKVLSVALCDHYNWARQCIDEPALQKANYSKPNILILGPTGSGKTYLVRTLAKMLGVPFVKADATKFSETGIVGEDAEDVVRGLVDAAGGDSELAQYGMVYIDEVDKITGNAAKGGYSGGWSGRQVQSNFLKIMEDTEVSLKNSLQASLSGVFGAGAEDGKVISTKFMLFIFSGAFNGLNDLIKNRVGTQSIGFMVDDDNEDDRQNANNLSTSGSAGISTEIKNKGDVKETRSYLHLAETSDFIEAGLEPEFIGRIPVRVAIDALDANDLYRILTEAEDSILSQFENEFNGYGIKLTTQTDALKRVAEIAVEEKTGARALVTVLEKVLREFKFEMPSTSCKELKLTRKLLDHPLDVLNALLSEPSVVEGDVQRWLEDVEKRSKVRVVLDDEVRKKVVEECASMKCSAERLLVQRFLDTGVIEGFSSIQDATNGNISLFTVSMAMYENPEEEIAKWKKSLDGIGA